ncbi:MAG TPA: DUF5666 domain-containing protein [Terracidiphilus sp.]|nr:DUF5666 domain-containing protein [Terracidiphilus sp.]
MNSPLPRLHHQFEFPILSVLSASILTLSAAFTSGCGGSGGGTATALSGSTNVIILASSTANDQLWQFSLTLQSLTLTSQSGKTVTLLSAVQGEEFIHVNGNVEPLASAVVPQGIYTSATATVSSAYPACAGQGAGTLLVDEALNGPGGSSVTVNLPQAITVTGATMGLALDLQVSKSALFSGGCTQSLTNSVPVAPVFNLTPVVIAAQPTNRTNGKALGLEGLISSIDASRTGFSVNALYSMNGGIPPKWQVAVNGSTLFQGVGDSSQLAAGMPIDMDVAIQSDGTLLATRVAVLDTDATNLSVSHGPLLSMPSSKSAAMALVNGFQGMISSTFDEFDFSNASFQISSRFTNLQSLPFAATFTATNMVDGQNVFVSSHAQLVNGFPPLPMPVTTMTLIPQTIDGTVSAVSNEGSFTTYTVTLAPYDLFPNLAVQAGQTTLLTKPNTVVVYADSNTQKLNTNPPAAGSVLRFNGLVFNDNGTLRMDCAQINDGVAL